MVYHQLIYHITETEDVKYHRLIASLKSTKKRSKFRETIELRGFSRLE